MLVDNMSQKRIAIKLAKISVAIAFTVGLLLSSLQVYRDYVQEHESRKEAINRILQVAERSATVSVHNLNEVLASEVIEGLFEYDFIQHAKIVDDLGATLAEQQRPEIKDNYTQWLTAKLSEQYEDYSIMLFPLGVDAGTPGRLTIVVNVDMALVPFYSRSLIVFFGGIVRNIILALLLFLAFHFIITRPLINLVRELKKINPEDQTSQLQTPLGHEDDEFNLVTQSANDLIDGNHKYIVKLHNKNKDLTESEGQIKTLVTTIPDLIWLKDPEGVYLSCNYPFERFIGEKEADIIGKTDYDFVDKELADFFRTKDQAAMMVAQSTSSEDEAIFSDDGHKAILHTVKTPMRDNEGKLIGLLGIARDITQSRQTEVDLLTSEEQYAKLIANVPGVTYHCTCDEFWTMHFISNEIENITGFPASDFIDNKKRTYVSIIHPDDVQLIDEAVQSKVDKKLPYTVEYRLITSSDKIVWVYEKGQGLFTEDGDLYRLDGVIIDITERKNAEMEVGTLRSYLSNIIDSMPSIIIGVNKNGIVTEWNIGAERAAKIVTNEAVGLPLSKAFPRLASETKRIQLAIDSHQEQKDKKRSYLLSNGELAYEDITIYPLIANGVEGAVIRVDDVSEQVRLEEMMIQSEKMLSVGGLAAGMAHEINNPLAGMMQTANVMVNRLTNKTVQANLDFAASVGTDMETISNFMEQRGILRMLNAINESGERVADIVNNMLSFSRKSIDVYSSHDINELLDKAIGLSSTDYNLINQYDFKSISIEKDYGNDIGPVACDNVKIQQVLLNVFRNGAEAMQEAGVEYPEFKIKTYFDAVNDNVCITIEDNGPGMGDDIRKRIFEPFYTTKPIGVGTGLGLSVSYFIITENHGGGMSVESELGVGSKFIISLPMSNVSQ
jgi:PAS domain S-box-containing protein